MALQENDVRFFRPLWIRVLVTAVVAGWCLAEIILSHDQMWIGITGVGVIYCVYNFFWKFPRNEPAPAAPAAAEPAALPIEQPTTTEPPKQADAGAGPPQKGHP